MIAIYRGNNKNSKKKSTYAKLFNIIVINKRQIEKKMISIFYLLDE